MMHANKQEKTIHLMHTTTNCKHTFYGKNAAPWIIIIIISLMTLTTMIKSKNYSIQYIVVHSEFEILFTAFFNSLETKNKCSLSFYEISFNLFDLLCVFSRIISSKFASELKYSWNSDQIPIGKRWPFLMKQANFKQVLTSLNWDQNYVPWVNGFAFLLEAHQFTKWEKNSKTIAFFCDAQAQTS